MKLRICGAPCRFPCKYEKKIENEGTRSVISSDSPFIEWHDRFTMVPLKGLSDQE